MKLIKVPFLALAAAMLTSAAYAVSTDTLANLAANNGTLTIGDKTFSGFSFQANGLTNFNASTIQVTASIQDGVYYLDWTGNMSVATSSGPTSADLLLKYTVAATAGSISMIDQLYTGSATPRGQSFLSIDETVRVGSIILANSHLDENDLSDPFAEQGDNLFVNPAQTVLNVTKDIGFGISGTAGFVTISDVEQSFHQTVPDAGFTASLLGIGLLGVAALRRKLTA